MTTRDIRHLEIELSEALAEATDDLGFNNCFERAQAALKLCDPALEFSYTEGTLYADQGMEPDGYGRHAWLTTPQGTIIDPAVAAVFMAKGFITGLRWESAVSS